MSVGDGLSGGCRARFILKRGSRLPVFAIQAADLQAEEAAWLNEDGVHPVCRLLVPSSGPSEGGSTRDAAGTIDNRGKPGRAQQNAHAYRDMI